MKPNETFVEKAYKLVYSLFTKTNSCCLTKKLFYYLKEKKQHDIFRQWISKPQQIILLQRFPLKEVELSYHSPFFSFSSNFEVCMNTMITNQQL